MNLKTKHFRKGILSSDFISKTIPYDYEPSDVVKKSFVKSVLLKILNNNREHLEYFLSIIGYTFIGSPELEKSIYFCVDKTELSSGDNGKTFFFDILTTLFPNYVYKTKGSFLEKSNTKVHKQLAKMKGMRLVWLDEFGKAKTNSELMKEIGDGLGIENEKMFGTSDVINIMFKLFALTNHLPDIDAKDTAVYNRYKQISYASHFDRTGSRLVEDPDNLLFIADTSLGNTLKQQYYNEIFDIVIEYAHKYYENKLPRIPQQFIQDTKDTKKNNDVFAQWFDENCDNNSYERIPLVVIVNESGFKERIIKEGMLRLGFKYNKDLSKMGKDINGKAYKGGFEGVMMKPVVNVVEEEEE
jgi:phage/plasmid-associated DNA primase